MSAGTTNEKDLTAYNGQAPGTTNEVIVYGGTCLDKSLAALQAEAALAGCGLYPLACGGWLLTRWGMAKECPDLRAVAALLARMGGAR